MFFLEFQGGRQGVIVGNIRKPFVSKAEETEASRFRADQLLWAKVELQDRRSEEKKTEKQRENGRKMKLKRRHKTQTKRRPEKELLSKKPFVASFFGLKQDTEGLRFLKGF